MVSFGEIMAAMATLRLGLSVLSVVRVGEGTVLEKSTRIYSESFEHAEKENKKIESRMVIKYCLRIILINNPLWFRNGN